MYICICNGITDKDIKDAAAGGVATAAGVYRAHECAPQCGKCVPYIKEIIGAEGAGAGFTGDALRAPEK